MGEHGPGRVARGRLTFVGVAGIIKHTPMPSLLERLREALSPLYEVERELASGGMGLVFLGRDPALDRRVAIKILRPELATALAAERFLREARVLAKLGHPHIVPVHHVGEAGGFFYYVMELLQGETLADRLARGALPAREALKLGRDLLDALEASHRHGVVHRDIKPSNVFLLGGRAVLTDFGIAKPSSDPGEPLTASGQRVGTPEYMPPEQAAGGEVTSRTDLYAVGMVLYEALTRRQWSILDRPERANWSGVPRGIARVLRRSLEWAPEDRWPDAPAFRHALWRTRVWPYRRRTIGLTLAGVVTGAVIATIVSRNPKESAAFRIRIAPFLEQGLGNLSGVGDSLARALDRRLSGYPDFTVEGAGDPGGDRGGSATKVTGTVSLAGEALRVELYVNGRTAVVQSGRSSQWERLVDTLAAGLLDQILRSPLDPLLPAAVRPKTAAGLAAYWKAEGLFAQAQWGAAYAAYGDAATADTTCWMCYWRHVEVGRWLGLEPDESDRARILRHIEAFPSPYQSLIGATSLPILQRLEALEDVTRRWREFLFGWFRRSDELFHRGPLVGRARRESVTPFYEVLRLRPDFGPALEHLTWLEIAEGNLPEAQKLLDRLRRHGIPEDVPTLGIRALLEVAFAWRFRDARAVTRVTDEWVRRSEQSGVPTLPAGPRYLTYFDAPRGAIDLGREFEQRPNLARSGLIAQVMGHVAVGRTDSARLVLLRLRDRFPEPNLALFAAELDGALLLLDSDTGDAARGLPAIQRSLEEHATLRAGSAQAQYRVAWMLTLLSQRITAGKDAGRYRARLRDEPSPAPLTRLVRVDSIARRGKYARALAISDTLTVLQAQHIVDPFFRTVLHLLRAEWNDALGRRESARRELLWHENSDDYGLPTGDPQAEDVDWVFGTLARWRRAQLLEGAAEWRDEVCRAYGAVVRLWASGESRFAARADTARQKRAALNCPPAS